MTVIGGFLLPAALLAPGKLAAQGGWILVAADTLIFLLGLHLLAGRFVYDAARRKRTLYALTDRRFLILSGLWWQFCRSRALNEIWVVFRREDRPGRTTIWLDSWPLLQLLRRRFSFGPAPSAADFQAFPVPRISGLYSIRFGWFGFELIEDGDDVAALIKDAHEKARS